jgi:hypothetical protein
MDQLVTLVAGFVLTTVLGGLLGAFLQRRTWDHQNAVQAEQTAVARADEICRQVMGLLDKRLYRMLRLYYACRAAEPGVDRARVLDVRLSDYDSVLFEWNDQLNSGLALVSTYFGRGARDWLEVEVYTGFQEVGSELERLYRLSREDAERTAGLEQVRNGLEVMNDRVYRLGVFMTAQLLARRVGMNASDPATPVDSPREVGGRAVPLPAESHRRPRVDG